MPLCVSSGSAPEKVSTRGQKAKTQTLAKSPATGSFVMQMVSGEPPLAFPRGLLLLSSPSGGLAFHVSSSSFLGVSVKLIGC